MELVHYETEVDGRAERIILRPIGDTHEGVKNCDEDKLKEDIEFIRSHSNCRWLGMGDYCDFINYTDKRFDSRDLHTRHERHLDNLHYEQLNYMSKLLKPIAGKCIGLLEGNHEETIRKKYHCDPVGIMAYNLKTKSLTDTTMIKWNFVRRSSGGHRACKTLTIFARHGSESCRTDGAALNALFAKAKDFEADIYLMGHVHRKVHGESCFLAFGGSEKLPRLVNKKKLFVVTGTYYKTYQNGTSNYAQKKGYSPTPTGSPIIYIDPYVQVRIEGDIVDQPIKFNVGI